MRIRALFLFALLGSAAVAACTGSREAPLAPSGDAALSSSGAATRLIPVGVLQRLQPLAEPLSATGSFGRNGGRLSIPEAGLEVDVPGNAVAGLGRNETVEITVTALAGANVAYEFEPHGLHFQNELHVRQDTHLLTGGDHPQLALGAYFADPSLLADGTASVSEFRPTGLDVNGHRIEWTVEHFSGYLLASEVRTTSSF